MNECPICGKDVYEELSRYFWMMIPTGNFDFECPYCAGELEVEMIPVPEFKITAPTGSRDQEGE